MHWPRQQAAARCDVQLFAPPARCRSWLTGGGISGGFPAAWMRPGALRHVRRLTLQGVALTGRLPPALPNAFPALRALTIGSTQLTGPLPPSWASAELKSL